jgi:peptidoglycan/xylan/chitin deacetylase (PgdA/CDA1 family)
MPMARSIKSSLILLTIVLISGCGISDSHATPSGLSTETFTLTSLPPTPDPPTETPLPTQTATATVTPTPTWIFQSGAITCPILLYHRIAEPPLPNSIAAQYYTPPVDFQWQMQALKDWGYTTIPISLLVTAIIKGAPLPPRPVVISFDDGYESVYKNAYPTMQAQEFTGVLYLVGNYIGAQDYMDINQIQEMTGNGWEIGSHSMTHPDLRTDHDQITFEGGQSKGLLSSEIGVKVQTFAYPFGGSDSFVFNKIAEYGYIAAVGLGTQFIHGTDTLYYLSRIEIQNGTDLTAFAALLPWSGLP